MESYDAAVAQIHSRLLATGHCEGNQRGARDLIIAATTATTKPTIVTVDRTPGSGT